MKSKKNKNIIEYLKKRNVKRFSIFIAIAFVFLILSKLSNNYKQTIKLKISLENVEDEIILQNDSLNILEGVVEAKGFALLPYMFKSSEKITIDAKTDVLSKTNVFIFDAQKHKFLIEDQLGSSYKILSIKPDTLSMLYSKRASKYVPLLLKEDISFAVGYDIFENYNLSIDSVKVVGATDEIQKIESVSTEVLSIKDVNSNIKEDVNIDFIDGVDVFPKTITVNAVVKRFTEGIIEVPIKIINKPLNTTINYFPKTVTISYYVDLDNYNAIKASDFVVECDYNSKYDDQSFLIPKLIKQPKFVKRISIKQKRIDFIKL